MLARRVCCAVALICLAACSFPDYHTPDAALPDTCANHVRDGLEAGIDCGGGCDPCPVCSDGKQNGDETGIDCGGSCDACPTCSDGEQNGNESDVDCGGTCQARCSVDQRCREGVDCVALVCATNVCQRPTCNDQVRNGHETGVDCGGDCPGCDNGNACSVNADCKSLRCQGEVCVDAGCTDKITNGTESDVDCGGAACAPCKASKICTAADDCESRICESKRCGAASCTDRVQNQGESDVDCGGSNCAACPVGKACSQPRDCETALCQSATCVPENPLGQPLSRGKWKLSSSESDTETGQSEPFDGDVATVWTSGAPQHSKMFVVVDLGQPEIFFKALLQTTVAPYDQDFPVMLNVYLSTDGEYGDPVRSNQMGNPWTWVDFPGAQVARYIRFELTQPSAHPWSIGELNLYN